MMGLVYAFAGVGELVGPIICGLLLDTYHDYNPLIYFTIAGYTGAFLLMSLSYLCLLRDPQPA